MPRRIQRVFYQLYRTKAKEGIGPLKGMDGSLIEKGEEIRKELNNYFLSVFIQEQPDGELDLEQIFRGQEADILNDICIGRVMVRKDR